MLKPPLFVTWNLFLLVSLSAPLIAGPSFVLKKEDRDRITSEQQPAQERRASENEGSPSSEQLVTTAHIKDWDDLLNEQTSQQSGEAPKKEREKILERLAQAAQQAYAQGDENHSDWNKVAEAIEELRPDNGVKHLERRLSVGDDANEADVEELQFHFFCSTLPAIKKTSVIAPLRRLNNFKTAAIIEKGNEEQASWEAAKANFEKVCEEHGLHTSDNIQPIPGLED